MSAFDISFDWIDFSEGVDESSLQATFARVSITVGAVKVTRVLDERAQSSRDFVTIPLYPLTEWIAANWWCLFEEAEVPSRGISSEEYRSRHGLREGREGYAFPDLQLFPEGQWTLLKWAPSRAAYQLVEFLESGHDRVKTHELREKFSDLINAVLDRLEARGLRDTWLQNEWRAIREMDPEEVEFCRAAGRLGLDPYQLDGSTSNEIILAVQRLPKHIQEEVLKAAPPPRLGTSVDWVDSGLLAIKSNSMVDGRWNELRDRISPQPMENLPWQSGYTLATQLREILHLADCLPVAIDELVGSPFPIVQAIAPPAASFDGLIGVGESSLCCYTAKVRSSSQRFLCARGLVGFLFDKSNQTEFYSSAQTNIQQRSRAFAAEFLAPASLIQKQLSGDDISSEEVEELAAQFQVSSFVIDHQIRNHRLGKIIGSFGQ